MTFNVNSIPVDTFKATVQRCSELSAIGEDEDFGKEDDRLSTMDTPPFYGTRQCSPFSRAARRIAGKFFQISCIETCGMIKSKHPVREACFMAKNIKRIVLTGGPAAGKTSLVERLKKEFRTENGWRLITIPESATKFISDYGIGPFPGCMSMYSFQYYIFSDMLHNEELAIRAANEVPEQNVLIVYDRAIFDNRGYVSPKEFREILAGFGKTEEQVLAGYDAVIHMVSCAKGARFAYDHGNTARYEDADSAAKIDDEILEGWKDHPCVRVIENRDVFEEKIELAVQTVCELCEKEYPLP